MKCATVTTQKEGVGKTFASVQSAYRLLLGPPRLSVCVLGLDRQGNSSRAIQRGAPTLEAEGLDVHFLRVTFVRALDGSEASGDMDGDATGPGRANPVPLPSTSAVGASL